MESGTNPLAIMKVMLSKLKGHLVFRQSEFKDGIEVKGKSKIGCLEIEESADADEVLAFAKSIDWKFKGSADDNGFTEVVRA